jgi:hypothetical protein
MGTASSYLPNSPAASKTVDQTNHLYELRQVYAKFHFSCRTCRASFSPQDLKSNVEAWFGPNSKNHIPTSLCLSVFNCNACNTSTCAGCGCKPSNANIPATSSDTLSNCCEEGRLLGIWLTLCQFDDSELELQAQVSKAKAQNPKASKIAQDTGVGYDVAYGWTSEVALSVAKASTTKIIEIGEASDDRMVTTVVLLSRQLQTPDRASTSLNTQDE